MASSSTTNTRPPGSGGMAVLATTSGVRCAGGQKGLHGVQRREELTSDGLRIGSGPLVPLEPGDQAPLLHVPEQAPQVGQGFCKGRLHAAVPLGPSTTK
jgi:hypothetical protein